MLVQDFRKLLLPKDPCYEQGGERNHLFSAWHHPHPPQAPGHQAEPHFQHVSDNLFRKMEADILKMLSERDFLLSVHLVTTPSSTPC